MQLTDLVPVAIVFIVAAVAIGFGAKILTDIGAGQTGTSAAIISNGTESLNQLGKYLPTLALVAVAAIVVGLVVTAFAFRR
jgi:hypothetical protein